MHAENALTGLRISAIPSEPPCLYEYFDLNLLMRIKVMTAHTRYVPYFHCDRYTCTSVPLSTPLPKRNVRA